MKYRITSQGWEKVSEDADPDWQSIATALAKPALDAYRWFDAMEEQPEIEEELGAALERFRAAGGAL